MAKNILPADGVLDSTESRALHDATSAVNRAHASQRIEYRDARPTGVDGYRADDRKDDEEGEDIGEPVTATALAMMWAERDARYAALQSALRPEQIAVIRAYRIAEVNTLPPGERGKAGIAALSWYPA